MEIRDEPLDYAELLIVLLAEVSAIRMDDLEQFCANGSHSAEVARALRPLPPLRNASNLDHSRAADRVDCRSGRREECVDTCLLRQFGVAFLLARISVEIFVRAELGRIHENRSYHHLAIGAG